MDVEPKAKRADLYRKIYERMGLDYTDEDLKYTQEKLPAVAAVRIRKHKEADDEEDSSEEEEDKGKQSDEEDEDEEDPEYEVNLPSSLQFS